jgi:hypothetical protein
MKKSDFFDELIFAFELSKHHEPHLHEPEPPIGPLSVSVVYYEWSKTENKWLKLRENDPDPDQSLPNGDFDGQVIEIIL